MSELSKITTDHLRRRAVVYVRQSSTTQVEHNRESTARQYQLAERAVTLGWAPDQVKVTHGSRVSSASFSLDGKRVVTASLDKTAASGTPRRESLWAGR